MGLVFKRRTVKTTHRTVAPHAFSIGLLRYLLTEPLNLPQSSKYILPLSNESFEEEFCMLNLSYLCEISSRMKSRIFKSSR